MPDAIRGGFPVHLRSFGTGRDPALLLHCALAHSKAWTPLAEQFSDRLAMLAPDMPGHGRSAKWDHRQDLHDQVTAIARDCLGDGGHVIGHSFGATVALRLAIEAPEAVRSLTLIEPVLFAAAGESESDVLCGYINETEAFNAALARDDWTSAAKDFIRIWGDGRPWEALTEREQELFASQMHFIRETEACLLKDSAGLLLPGRLESIRCPVHLIRGGSSVPIIAAIHRTLAGRIPGARDCVIAGAGHMVPITHPTPVAREIAPLLDLASA